MANGVNIRVSEDTHKSLVRHLEKTEKKIGKWVEFAIEEKIIKETKKKKSTA